jgi:hypothetical protein
VYVKNQKVNEDEMFDSSSVKSLRFEVKVSNPVNSENNMSSDKKQDCSRTKYECCPDGVTPANVIDELVLK